MWLSYEDVDKKRRDIGAALVWYFKQLKGAKKAKDIEIVNEIKDDMGLAMDTVSLWGTNTAGILFCVQFKLDVVLTCCSTYP